MVKFLLLILIFQAVFCTGDIKRTHEVLNGLGQHQIEGPLPEIHGEDFELSSYPNIVGIFQPNPLTGTFSFICTGVRISPYEILTSAHALQNLAPQEITVFARDSEQFLLAENISLHDRYKSGNKEFDLALILLDQSSPHTENALKQIKWPNVLTLSVIPNEGLEVIRLEVTPENDYYTTSSDKTFLGPGNSGSPLYVPDENGNPILRGIFSRQQFSLDRSRQTRYYFAEVDSRISTSVFNQNVYSRELSHHALITLKELGSYSIHYSENNRFNNLKNLYACAFINRSDKTMSISFTDLLDQGISTIAYKLGIPEKKTISNDFTSRIQLTPDYCLIVIFRPYQEEGKLTLQVNNPSHFANPPPK